MNDLSHNDETLKIFDLSDVDGDEAGLLPYLGFELNQALYAVDIQRVREIKGWEPLTPIPNTPEHLCGVLNWGGEIVPVVDLRLLLEMPFQPYSKTTVVLILQVQGETSRTVGVAIDGACNAHYIAPEAISAVPDFGDRVTTDFINGISRINDNMLMLLDIDQLLHPERLG